MMFVDTSKPNHDDFGHDYHDEDRDACHDRDWDSH